MKNIVCLVYFAKDAEERFGYGKLNVFVIKCVNNNNNRIR